MKNSPKEKWVKVHRNSQTRVGLSAKDNFILLDFFDPVFFLLFFVGIRSEQDVFIRLVNSATKQVRSEICVAFMFEKRNYHTFYFPTYEANQHSFPATLMSCFHATKALTIDDLKVQLPIDLKSFPFFIFFYHNSTRKTLDQTLKNTENTFT